jgi:hypothetical protein
VTCSPGVMPQLAGLGSRRQVATCDRISLMIGVGLYSCSTEDRPSATLNARLPCRALAFSFLGLGTGVRSSERRRPCAGGRPGGCPPGSRA